MLRFLWRATRGHRFMPWRSPYLRWRIETYWGIPAERIGWREFWRFAWSQRRGLLRFLRWAARMQTAALTATRAEAENKKEQPLIHRIHEQ